MCLIALTATRPHQQQEKVLTSIYKKLDFHSLIDPTHDIEHEGKPEYILVDDVEDFLKKSKGYGAIIWTDDEKSDEIMAAVSIRETRREKPRKIREDPTEPEFYRAMEDKLAILTDERGVRGLDFKLSQEFKDSEVYDPDRGIDLLLAAPLPNKRAYDQAGGRVGRFSERAGYYVLKSIAK